MRVLGSVVQRGRLELCRTVVRIAAGLVGSMRKTSAKAGYSHSDDPEPDFCSIRNLSIDNPFYTYCANHPHRRPERDAIPIGPVFVGEHREEWQDSPDTEEVRAHLLELLSVIPEQPQTEYQPAIMPTRSWCGSWVSSVKSEP
jgi:hypothetical protein